MYACEQSVRYCILYEPQSDGTCNQTVYKVLISNVVDGRSLYREWTSMDSFRGRELKRAYPNKHRTIKWTSIYREDEFQQLQDGNIRCGMEPMVIHKELGPSWWSYFDEVKYDRKKQRYVK